MSTDKIVGDAVSHHRSQCQFMWPLTLNGVRVIPKRLNPGKTPSFLVSYKYNIKTITVLGIKDVLVSKDSKQKWKTKGEEKGNETVQTIW